MGCSFVHKLPLKNKITSLTELSVWTIDGVVLERQEHVLTRTKEQARNVNTTIEVTWTTAISLTEKTTNKEKP